MNPLFCTLCLDCSQKNLTIAVIGQKQVLAAFNGIPATSQSEELVGRVDEVLSQAKVSLDDIKQVLFCHGPGSFTSLRIGLASLRGLFWERPVAYFVASSLAFRCLSGLREGDAGVVAAIPLGREKVAMGVLKGGNVDATAPVFFEKIVSREEYQQYLSENPDNLRDVGDVVEPEAFLRLMAQGFCVSADIRAAKVNYLVEPELGRPGGSGVYPTS